MFTAPSDQNVMEGHSYDYESVASLAMSLDVEKRTLTEDEQPRWTWTQRPMLRVYAVQLGMVAVFLLIFLISWYYIRELSVHQPRELMVCGDQLGIEIVRS